MFAHFYDREARPTTQAFQSVPVAQLRWELEQLVELYKSCQPRTVVEIGVQSGGTLYHWLTHAPDNAIVVGVDLIGHRPKDQSSYLPLWESWCREGVVFRFIQDDSHREDTMERVRNYVGGIDWLFIDGDHTYEGALADFEMYGPLVNAGGVIAFHDLMTPTNPVQQHIQVGRLWREIQACGYITQEFRASTGAPWGGIGVIYV